MDDSPGDLILDQKEKGVKLYKDMVIICEAVNGKQILGCIGDMKNITEFKFFRRATNYRVTNM
jgi:hypothetical protein